MLDKGRRRLHEGGGTVWNTLKGGGTEKRGRETKILKRGQPGPRGGYPKIGGWSPLANYDIKISEKIHNNDMVTSYIKSHI